MPKTVYDQQVIGTGLMANYADWLGRGVWNGGVCVWSRRRVLWGKNLGY